MKIQSTLAIILLLFIQACSSGLSIVPTQVADLIATHTSSPTATSTPTPTPTPLPPLVPITALNASQIGEILTFGRGTLYDIVLAPGGREILIATSLGFYYCDARTLQVREFIPVNLDYSGGIALSPDGQHIAFKIDSKEFQQELMIYDVTSKEFSTLYVPPFNWYMLDFSWNPDGSAVAFNSQNWNGWGETSILMVELEGGEITLNAPVSGWPETPRWAPDGQKFAVSMGSNPNVTRSIEYVIQLWSPGRSNPLLSIPTSSYGSLEWSHDATKLSFLTQEGSVYIYDVATGDELLHAESGLQPEKTRYGIGFDMLQQWSDDDQAIQFIDLHGGIWQVDVSNGQVTQISDGTPDMSVFALSFASPMVYTTTGGFAWDWIDSTTGLVSSTDILGGNLVAVELETNERTGTFAGLGASAYGPTVDYAVLMREQGLVCTARDYLDYDDNFRGRIVRFWDLASGEELLDQDVETCRIGDEAAASQAGWSGPVGPAIKTVNNSTSISVYPEGESWRSPDGNINLVVAPGGAIQVSSETNDNSYTVSVSGFGVSELVGSPDGAFVAARGKDRVVKVWRLEDGQLFGSFTAGAPFSFPLVWSPNNERILFFDNIDSAKIYALGDESTTSVDIDNRKVGEFVPEYFSWSPDGTMILAAYDLGVDLFDAESGQVLKHLSDETIDSFAQGFGLNWLAEGALILISNGNGTISVWSGQTP